MCKDCRQKEEDAKKPKISLKLRVGASSSPAPPSPASTKPTFAGVERPRQQTSRRLSQGSLVNGYPSSPNQPAQRPQHSQLDGLPPPQHYGSSQRAHPGSPQQPQTYGNPPLKSGYQAIQPHSSTMNNELNSSTLPPTPNSPPYNGRMPYHHQNSPAGQRPPTPLPIPKHQALIANSSPNNGRLPSPVFNRPTMSPTQGNMDVGPLAGIPLDAAQSPQPAPNRAHPSGNSGPSHTHVTPRPDFQNQSTVTHQTPISRTPKYPHSGLSPKKQQTPRTLPPLGNIHQKLSSMSPPLPMSSTASKTFPPSNESAIPAIAGEPRTVSGTPILPPVENLRPSPQQLRNSSSTGPVPTPSKQPQPRPQLLPQVHQLESAGQGQAAAKQANQQAIHANAAVAADANTNADLQTKLGNQADRLRNAQNASHPQIRDLAMQDVQ